jgi:hypothetical protein
LLISYVIYALRNVIYRLHYVKYIFHFLREILGGIPGDIRAGCVFVELFADDSRLSRGFKQAEKKLAALGADVRGTGLKPAGVGSLITAP